MIQQLGEYDGVPLPALYPLRDTESIPLGIVPPDVLAIARRLHESNFGVWFVGGALRDLLLARKPKDWDLATSASPGQVMKLFARVIPVGLGHGTVCVHWNATQVELTSVPPGGDEGILSDLGRRDFTVNAMALTYPDGILLDPHHGRKDLRSRTLRAVGDARARFREDPLRIVRACRLVGQHGFRIHRVSFRSMKEEIDGLELVASERIRDEMFRLIQGEGVKDAFELMRAGGVLRKVLPELAPVGGAAERRRRQQDVYRHTVAVVRSCPPRLTLRLAALFHDLGGFCTEVCGNCPTHGLDLFRESTKAAVRVLARWRASGRQIREVAALVANQIPRGIRGWSPGTIRRFIAQWGSASPEDVLDLALADRICSGGSDQLLEELSWFRSRAQEILESREAVTVRDLAVDGRDVMECLGLRPGPAVGIVLNKLRDMVIEEPSLNERKILMDFLKRTRL